MSQAADAKVLRPGTPVRDLVLPEVRAVAEVQVLGHSVRRGRNAAIRRGSRSLGHSERRSKLFSRFGWCV